MISIIVIGGATHMSQEEICEAHEINGFVEHVEVNSVTLTVITDEPINMDQAQILGEIGERLYSVDAVPLGNHIRMEFPLEV